MKILRSLCFFVGFICLTFQACNRKENVPLTPNWDETTELFNKGFETEDFAKKLVIYNEGLSKITDRRDTSLLGMLDGKVIIYISFKEFDSARSYTDSLLKASTFQKDTFYMSRVYYRRAQIDRKEYQPISFFENSFKARELLLKSGYVAAAARRSIDMANVQIDMGDYAGAQESATEALKFLNPTNFMDSIFVSSAYNVIGLSYLNRDLNLEAIKEYQQALTFAKREQDSLIFLHNIALAHKNEEEYETAIKIFEELKASNVPSTSSQHRILDNLLYTQWLYKPETVKDEDFHDVLEKRRELNDLDGMYNSYMHLSNFHAEVDKQQAKKYAEKLLPLAREMKSPESELLALRKLILFQANEQNKEIVSRYVVLDDSLDKARVQANYQFAKIRFDNKQNEQQIALLETQNYAQALEAEKLRNRHMVSSFAGVFIVILAALVLYYFRQRSKREKIKEIYLTESRISKRIHDELANDVYNLMSSLEGENSEKTVDKLEKIYNRTRDISRENREIETGEQFIEDLVTNISTNTGDAKIILRGERSFSWDNVGEEVKIVIYRVLQELMVNMRKHSKASLVAVSFTKGGKSIEIKYSDNGKGCTPDDFYKGSGLRNINRRVTSINGEIEWEVAEGKGCKAHIKIPA